MDNDKLANHMTYTVIKHILGRLKPPLGGCHGGVELNTLGR